MTSPMKLALLVACVAPMAACIQGYSATAPSTPSGCSANVVPALELQIRDSVTQKAAAAGVLATGLVTGQRGTYQITAPVTSDSLSIWFGTISGTYTVALHKSGYHDVTRSGIVVPPADSLDCHPNTVTLDVLLQPTS